MAEVINLKNARRKRQKSAGIKITATILQKAKPREARYVIRDAVVAGLVLRVEPSGAKAYYTARLMN